MTKTAGERTYSRLLGGFLCMLPVLLGMVSAPTRVPIRLLFTANLRGILEPCGCQPLQPGGLSRRATLLQGLRSEGEPVILVDVGDNLPAEGATSEMLRLVYGLLKRMRYDAVNVGPSDLTITGKEIKGAADQTGVPLLAHLTSDNQHHLVASARVAKAGAARVALIGTVPDSVGLDPDGLVNEMAALARRARASADLVVVVSQLPQRSVERLAQAIPEVDIFLSGRHDPDLTTVRRIGNAYLIPCPSYGQSVGVVDVYPQSASRLEKIECRYRRVDATLPEDPTVAKFVSEYYKKYSVVASQRVALKATERDLSGVLAKDGDAKWSCRGCHENEHASWSKTRHAHAWQTLIKGQATSRADCIPCHTTTQLALNGLGGASTGVGCTQCHGGDADHARHPDDPRFIVKRPSEAVCQACHNALTSPHFTYPSYLPKVAHTAHEDPVPASEPPSSQ